ncbi:hypothetical protein GC176_14300 [bacterium]|nr:hypothetical protein [bacterium]
MAELREYLPKPFLDAFLTTTSAFSYASQILRLADILAKILEHEGGDENGHPRMTEELAVEMFALSMRELRRSVPVASNALKPVRVELLKVAETRCEHHRAFDFAFLVQGAIIGLAGLFPVELTDENIGRQVTKMWSSIWPSLRAIERVDLTDINARMEREIVQAAESDRTPIVVDYPSDEFRERARPQSRELFRYLVAKPEKRVSIKTLTREFWKVRTPQVGTVQRAIQRLDDDLYKFASETGWKFARNSAEIWLKEN